MQSISDKISGLLLPNVQAPSQYVGMEVNRLWPSRAAQAQVNVAIAFPDTYSIGISHLGSQVLYHMLNDMPGVACDRAYCPRPDAEQSMRASGLPLFGWESRCPLRDFDILGFSLAYETLRHQRADHAGPGRHAAARRRAARRRPAHRWRRRPCRHAASRWPTSSTCSCPATARSRLPALVELVRQMKTAGASREEMILQAARTIPSAYAPRSTCPHAQADGTSRVAAGPRPDVPPIIERAHLGCMDRIARGDRARWCRWLRRVHDRVVIEVMRGCPNALPLLPGRRDPPARPHAQPRGNPGQRPRSAIAATGYHEISLLSLSTSDYPGLDELIDHLNAEFAPRHVSISLPSLRVDSQLRVLPKLTSEVRKGGLTIAAEAGERPAPQGHPQGHHRGGHARRRPGRLRGRLEAREGVLHGRPARRDATRTSTRSSTFAAGSPTRRKPWTASAAPSRPASHGWCPSRTRRCSGVRCAAPEYFWQVRDRLRDLSRRTPVAVQVPPHRAEPAGGPAVPRGPASGAA